MVENNKLLYKQYIRRLLPTAQLRLKTVYIPAHAISCACSTNYPVWIVHNCTEFLCHGVMESHKHFIRDLWQQGRWLQRQLKCSFCFQTSIWKDSLFSIRIHFPWESVKSSFAIAQLGNPISNVLFFRSGSSKWNSIILNFNYQGNRAFRSI